MTTQQTYSNIIARQLNISATQVTGTLNLFAEGGTIPFIARYRKEATGSLDEVAILAIQDQHHKLIEIDKRREAIIDSLKKNELINDPLTAQLQKAQSLTELEDIYLPYRPKRKTRGLLAREKGLTPLAEQIFAKSNLSVNISEFFNQEKGVITEEDALAGARDIIAEQIAEDQPTRAELRRLFQKQAIVEARVIKKNMLRLFG